MGRRGRVRKFGTDNGFEEQGGYMAAKKAKLEEQFEKEAKAEGEREGIFRYTYFSLFIHLFVIRDKMPETSSKIAKTSSVHFHQI